MIELRVLQEMSFVEIASALDLTEQTARKRFSRALANLRDGMARHERATTDR